MPNVLLRLMLLAAAILASGCTPLATFTAPDASKLKELPANHGMLALRVVDLCEGLPLEYVTFRSAAAKAAKSPRIRAHSISRRGVSIFVATIRAGRYSLSELAGEFGVGPRGVRRVNLERHIESTPDFGTFTARPGELSDLGTVYCYPAPNGERYRNLLVRSETFPGLDALLAADYAALETTLGDTASPLGWDENPVAENQSNRYPSIALNPVVFDQAIVFDDEVVILSRAGSMLRGKAGEEWKADAVDSDTAIVFVDKNSHGDMIAVTEDGGLFLQPAGTRGWSHLAGPDSPGKLAAATVNDGGVLHAFLLEKHTITVFEGRTGSAGPVWRTRLGYRQDLDWQTLTDGQALPPFTPEPASVRRSSIWTYGALKKASFTSRDQQLVIAARGNTYTFDKESAAVTHVHNKVAVRELSSNGRLLLTGEASPFQTDAGRLWSGELGGRWRTLHLALDRCPEEPGSAGTCSEDGTVKITRARQAYNPYITEDGTLYAVLLPHFTSDRPPLLARYRPGKGPWKRVKTSQAFPQYCNRIFPSGQEDILIIGCSGTSGRLYEYDIAKGTYTLVREPENFWTQPKPLSGIERTRSGVTHAKKRGPGIAQNVAGYTGETPGIGNAH